MKKIARISFISSVILWPLFFPYLGLSQGDPWKKVDEGLFWAEFESPGRVSPQESKIVIVKIDPRFYSFKLLCATEQGKTRLTVKDWCLKYDLISAINAGMYQKDGLTNVGYMKTFDHVNNPRLNNTYKSVLAFNRTTPGVPEIQIIDLKYRAFDELKSRYQTFVQNIRMISSQQENVWTKQDRVWSLAVLGMDKSGNGLFIFSEVPYSGHDFNNVLLSLPISIFNAMYLEGGAQASLYLSENNLELDRVGIYETGLNESRVRTTARAVPNVIGITKKAR